MQRRLKDIVIKGGFIMPKLKTNKAAAKRFKRNMMLKLMEYNSPYLRLTEKGLDLSNMVMSDFLLD